MTLNRVMGMVSAIIAAEVDMATQAPLYACVAPCLSQLCRPYSCLSRMSVRDHDLRFLECISGFGGTGSRRRALRHILKMC